MFRALLLPVALLASRAFAQTYTDCNPLKTTCPADPALGTSYNDTFGPQTSQLNTQLWNVTAGLSNIQFGNDGAQLSMYQKGDSVTAQSNFYIFWGEVTITMKASPGQGVISTLVLLSDDLDEIDFEIMGGNTTHVETNWYGHGNTSQINSIYYPISPGAQQGFHDYTFQWNQNQINWLINGNVVRTVPYAPSGEYPQTPCFVRFGIWAAGDSDQPGTVKWAGGPTQWSQAPFTMEVKSIKVTDGTTNSSSYVYGGNSGDWQSIQINQGQSKAYQVLNDPGFVGSAEKKWNGLSSAAKIAIAASVIGVFVIGLITFTWFCLRQRKAGREEKKLADRAWDQQQAEMMAYRNRMAKGGFAVSSMGHGEKF